MNDKHDETRDAVRKGVPALGRRDLMKFGAGVVATALSAPNAEAQTITGASWPPPTRSRAGYVYTANRESAAGQMDDTTRKIIKFVSEFNETKLTPADIDVLNRIVLDAMAALVSGFEEGSVRLCAQLARQVPLGDNAPLRATVMGYGLTTSPELAAFANSAMVRHTDFNDLGPGGHVSDLIPAALSMGEAMHSTGLQVLTAIAIGYELRAVAPGVGAGGEAACAGMTAAKLMNLKEDRLANALTCALTSHYVTARGNGAMTMWKGLRSAEPVKCGVWGALMGREGITGPPQPFEGRGGLWARANGPENFTLPIAADGKLIIHQMGFKRYPAEGSSQATLDIIPEMRAWTKVDEIEALNIKFNSWAEIGDPPKWDPRNRETADHSFPYIVARALMDGEIYLDSFSEAKYRDPAALALMKRITLSPAPDFSSLGPASITIRKKNGEQKIFDTQGGRRQAPRGEHLSKPTPDHRLTFEEITEKFNRACAFKKVNDAQRDQARALWGNLKAVKDIGEATRSLAKFGNPKPWA